MIPDTLSSRYSSSKINDIWSPKGKILLEREFWIVVMKAQKNLGIKIPDSAIQAYEKVWDKINLKSIEKIEKKLRHDVNSRLEEFSRLAGYQHIHKGMTSRDLTDNVEQLQIIRSLRLIRTKTIAILYKLSIWSLKTKKILLASRTHNIPAQPTTLGKRLSMFGEEILFALKRLDNLIENYPIRGLQGAVGTQLDQIVLLKGDKEKVKILSEQISNHFGCKTSLNSLGQVYPRSIDMETVNALITVSSGISNFARTIRLMAGQGLVSEGFKKGQIYLDLSTNSPTVMRDIHATLLAQGVQTLDAPVSGGPAGAESGKMAIWVGGDEAAFQKALPVLQSVSDAPEHVGPIGAGSIAKLVHNLSGYMVQLSLAETFSMGVKAGLPPEALWRAVRKGAVGRKRTFDMMATQFLPGRFDPPDFALELARKDVALALEVGREYEVPMRLGHLVLQEMTEAMNRGWNRRDSRSSMILQEERSGVEIRIPKEILDQIVAEDG